MESVAQDRTCSKCGEIKALTEFYATKGQYKSFQCKKCRVQYQDKRRLVYSIMSDEERNIVTLGRNCTQCGKWHKWAMFKVNRWKKSGYDECCRICRNSADRATHKRPGPRHHRAQRARRRYDRIRRKPFHTTDSQWLAMCGCFGPACLCCGQVAPFVRDHIIPIALGGLDHITNVQPLCAKCNLSKGDRHIADYRNPNLLRQFLLDIVRLAML